MFSNSRKILLLFLSPFDLMFSYNCNSIYSLEEILSEKVLCISILSFTNYIDILLDSSPEYKSFHSETETLSTSALNSKQHMLQVQNMFFVKVSKLKISTNLSLWIIYLYFMLFLSKFFTLFFLDHFPKLENNSKKFWH